MEAGEGEEATRETKGFYFSHLLHILQERHKVSTFLRYLCYKRDKRFILFYIFFTFCTIFLFQEEEMKKEEERRESMEREEAEFVKRVRETGGGVIGLVNKTNNPVTFTSLRLLMERSQVKT